MSIPAIGPDESVKRSDTPTTQPGYDRNVSIPAVPTDPGAVRFDTDPVRSGDDRCVLGTAIAEDGRAGSFTVLHKQLLKVGNGCAP